MKKLMIAAAIVCAAAFAQAASYSWQASSDGITTDGAGWESYIGNSSVYFFAGDAGSRAAVSAALAVGNLTVLEDALASQVLGESDYGMFMFGDDSVGGKKFAADDGATVLNGYAVILDAQDASKSGYFFATDVLDVTVTDAIKGGQAASFGFGGIETTYSSGWTKIEAVPEPTSGLLLLLGVAGLALRRRRT